VKVTRESAVINCYCGICGAKDLEEQQLSKALTKKGYKKTPLSYSQMRSVAGKYGHSKEKYRTTT
jgi:hypothetical protein